MNHNVMMAGAVIFSVMLSLSFTSWLVGGGILLGEVEEQFGGEQTFEDACNERFGVEWEYSGIDKIDGETPDTSIGALPGNIQVEEPVDRTVTIGCRLDKGFWTSTHESITLNLTSR